MLVIRVLMNVKPSAVDEFRAFAAEEGLAGQELAGCLHYAFYERVGTENGFLLYEEWESAQALDAYKASPAFSRNAERIFPLLEGKPESAYYASEQVGP